MDKLYQYHPIIYYLKIHVFYSDFLYSSINLELLEKKKLFSIFQLS